MNLQFNNINLMMSNSVGLSRQSFYIDQVQTTIFKTGNPTDNQRNHV